MFTNDYVMRMIEQFVRAIQKIMGLKESGEQAEAKALLEDTLNGLLGINADTVDALDYDGFIGVMNAGGALSSDRYILLSELLRLKAEFAREEGKDAAVDLYDKALCLYLAALADEPGLDGPRHTERVESLLAALQGFRLSERAYAGLALWHERAGRYSRAEDTLYARMDARGRDETSIRDTLDFYDRLLGQSPERLEQGNLPRDEVQAAREELLRRLPGA